MEKKCTCSKKDFYSAKEAKEFFNSNQWNISHYIKEKMKILQCPICMTLWELKYLNEYQEIIIRKKDSNPRAIKGKLVSLWIGEGIANIDITFKKSIIETVSKDDKRAILKTKNSFEYKGKKINHFLISNRNIGYLSDILKIRTLGVDVACIANEDNIDLDNTGKEQDKFLCQGAIILEDNGDGSI